MRLKQAAGNRPSQLRHLRYMKTGCCPMSGPRRSGIPPDNVSNRAAVENAEPGCRAVGGGAVLEVLHQRHRFGYRRLGLLLSREDTRLNQKKPYRLYWEERLTVRKRGGRKRALSMRAPIAVPQGRNLLWSLDFLADTLIHGRRFRILTLVDDFTRECFGPVVGTSLSELRVARKLDRIAGPYGRQAPDVPESR